MDTLDKQIKIKKFLMTLYQESIVKGNNLKDGEFIRIYQNNKEFSLVEFFNNIDDVISYVTNKKSSFVNTYFNLATTNGEGGASSDMIKRYCLGFDFDKKDNPNLNHKEIMERFKQHGLWYHALIDSGNGFHAYMMIEPTRDLDKVDQVQKAIGKILGADMKATLKTQILRVPYSWNVKDVNKKKEVRIISQFDRKTIKRYDINQLCTKFCQTSFRDESNNVLYINQSYPPCVQKVLNEGSKVGNRNNDLFNIVVALKHRGQNISQIKYVIDDWNNKNEKLLDNAPNEVERIFNNYNGFICSSCEDDIKIKCKKYTVSDFDLEQHGQPIIDVMNKVGRQLKKAKRKGVIEMNGNELFIYNVLVNNKNFIDMNINTIMESITDRETNKSALTLKTLRETLKGLEDKEYIEIIKGNSRQGIKDTYKVNQKKVTIDNSFKVTYFINLAVIWGKISTNELRCYIRMRYLHNELVKNGKAKGNIFMISLEDLAKDLGTNKSTIIKYIEKLYKANILDRRAIQKQGNSSQFYYEYKLNC